MKLRRGKEIGEYSLWLSVPFGLMSGIFVSLDTLSLIPIVIFWMLFFVLVHKKGFGYSLASFVIFGATSWGISAKTSFVFISQTWPMSILFIAFLTIPTVITTLHIWDGRPTEDKLYFLRSGTYHPVFLAGLGLLGGFSYSESPEGLRFFLLVMLVTGFLAFRMVRKHPYLQGMTLWFMCLVCFLTTTALFSKEIAFWTESQIATLKPGLTLIMVWIVGAMFLARILDRETQNSILKYSGEALVKKLISSSNNLPTR
ncbi:MAG: hypothetical protein A3F33_03100 [Candidatus Woykebacteria bacterium RIFCSPHIGHO2_12_FULL_43_10]|uniref:Uncharacterized protein n=2 Tax=Candidatus Woykeibacteriota TaxID=1817899 RepID=A0A1G1WY34_9BACT|nr:MAG: hypothetical protein A2802_01720 [Candidatus Woykebacteria bacterium RIFCSPHIGHO2_01_FULL_43_29]OGY28731.1 MAG: hypothetical protein A3J50_01300 [Candidatus Woykebacteria bacterium RIFCSPHIGHO2_02_FULL_43_16b]OGY29807.1 MAG: hypothetical protein A3F33_03100 [Candidatus Woykebacteria bacterium RIFCSPHIGHO2_12_FULL_43_10]OGY32481.1 MAG: hypothetical protein A3A61_00825 [Candidatus Woykebacteria bacterium RIFCSPLOWO2_01_FULL_43_14]